MNNNNVITKSSICVLAVMYIVIYVYILLPYGFGYADKLKYTLGAESFVISLWALFCYMASKFFSFKYKWGNNTLIAEYAVYSIWVVFMIWLLEEVLFKVKYMSADLIAQIYMYAVSIVAFFAFKMKGKGCDLRRKDCLYIIGITIFIGVFWALNQERLGEIITSTKLEMSTVDADGNFLNWISHRLLMLKSSLSGDLSAVDMHYKDQIIQRCSLAYISDISGWYGGFFIVNIAAAMIIIMCLYASKTKNPLHHLITFSLALKLAVGTITNLFLIFSTSVGLPLIGNPYDVVLLIMLLTKKKNRREKEGSDFKSSQI